MENYPLIENEEKKEKEQAAKTDSGVTASDNSAMITDSYNTIKSNANKAINSALSKTVNDLKKEAAKIPNVYKNLRNNLSLSNEKNKRATEEHIANTGNHTASGYAMSKRMNNENEYNKSMADLQSSERSELDAVSQKISQAKSDAAAKKAQLESEYDYKMLQDILSDQKFTEEKRMNDSKIKKTESDITINESKNKRDQEAHEMEMKYEPQVYEAKIAGIIKDNELTDAKIKNAYKTGGGSKSSSAVTSKMSAKDIATNIMKQVGLELFDSNGEPYYNYDNLDAYIHLITWQKKFGLSQQVVNDAAIYLGISDYI